MGGVTIAHQPEISTDDNFSSGFPANMKLDTSNQVVDNEQFNQLLTTTGQWPTDLPVEDLTGEVQDLMMRESMNSWLQPWMGENAACLAEFDAQMYAQSIQLEDLFGQDQLNFTQDMSQAGFYDELSFAHDSSSPEMSAPTSSASSPSDSSAQISPMVQPATGILIDEPLLEQLNVTEEYPVKLDEPVELVQRHEPLVETIEQPAEVVNNAALKRRRGSSSSEESSDDGSSSEEESDSEEETTVIPTTVANMNSRRRGSYSSSDDSESDDEPIHRRSRASSPSGSPYAFMHKRQIEETLLDRITNQLNPEKLPGILPILSSEKASNQQEDEVEIDLSCLAREQLVQVLSYVDACILEQNGGPAVNVDNYITKKPTKKGPRTRPALHVENEEEEQQQPQPKNRRPASKPRSRKPCKPRTQSRSELTEDLDADSSSSESVEYETMASSKNGSSNNGPMSMASLSKKNTSGAPLPNKVKGGRRKPSSNAGSKPVKKQNRRKGDDDALVTSSVNVFQDPDSIAISRPKRRAAIHKRRLLEEMLAPSDNEAEEDSEDSVLVVYSDEQMDLDVVDNQTIMHQEPVPVQLISNESEVVAIATARTDTEDCEDTDEDIDIMC
ncbi:hypothetical protein MFLAVUS_003345 [Mucor flavus]|uniref:NET domain-containing protein n=1 Tax=Mucor flavus TaxID=439312 RepID=A0ABP9YSX2_9FUNG